MCFPPFTRARPRLAPWLRYRGGMATDIWLFNLKNKSAKRVTDFEGTDTQPMWRGKDLYYLSDDGPSHRLNIWVVDPATAKRRQVTKYADHDVKWPAIGPGAKGAGEIVFQHGPELVLLDLSSDAARTVDVIIPGARPTLRARAVDAPAFGSASRKDRPNSRIELRGLKASTYKPTSVTFSSHDAAAYPRTNLRS